MKKTRLKSNRNSYQSLEARKMLAGDVTVTVDDGLLEITGDTEGNQIIVFGDANGLANVVGVGDTTINGGSGPFVSSISINEIEVELNDGDDSATIQGLILSRGIEVRAGDGDDQITVSQVDVESLQQFSGDGDDVVNLNNVFARDGSVSVFGQNGDDVISISTLAADEDVLIFGGSGNDTAAIADLGVRDDLTVNLNNGQDQTLLAGLIYSYRGTFLLGSGDDALSILPETGEEALFFRSLNVQGQAGDDSIVFDSNVSSPRLSIVSGGGGSDSFEQGEAALVRLRDRSIESQAVPNQSAQLDSVFSALSDNGIDTAPLGEIPEVVDPPVDSPVDPPVDEPTAPPVDPPVDLDVPTLTTSATALVQTENAGSSVLDSALTLVGDDVTFTGATISLGETFAGGQDEFDFEDNDTSDGISGNFNLLSGVLTLSGEGTAAQYQSALRAVTFDNVSEDPDVAPRTATITLSQSDGDDIVATREISVVSVNDAPIFTGVSTPITIDSADDPVSGIPVGLSGLTLEDEDSLQISGAVVSISDGFQDGDTLNFTPAGDITGTFDPITGVLTLAGDADASDYQLALDSITIDFLVSPDVGQRVLSVTVTDAQGDDSQTSDPVEVLVDVVESVGV